MKNSKFKKHILIFLTFIATTLFFSTNKKVYAAEHLILLQPFCKNIVISNGTDPNTLCIYSDEKRTTHIHSSDTIIITGKVENGSITILEHTNVKITLRDVLIDSMHIKDKSAFTIHPWSSVKLTLEGKNLLKSGYNAAGIYVDMFSYLAIYSKSNTNTLTSIGGFYGAGIGGTSYRDSGDVTISGGTVISIGGPYGAGIGGGNNSASGIININGGIIKATGGYLAAGIGGGNNAPSNIIQINNSTVTATASTEKNYASGAGIGGGTNCSSNEIIITNSIVTATGGISAISPCGAGIGGGANAHSNSIIISDSTIIAKSSSGAGIGGGAGATHHLIKLTSSQIDTKSNRGAGIGCGAEAKIDKKSCINIVDCDLCASSITISKAKY